MSDQTYTEAVDAAYRRMTRGEADEAIHQLYTSGQTSADEYIAYLRDELHEAWRKLYERDYQGEVEAAD